MLDSFVPSAGDAQPIPTQGRSASGDIAELKFQIERLHILCEAMWNILKEKHGLTDEELVRQMVLADMQDGALDGKVAKSPPQSCPKCKRVLAKNRPKCLFCGEPVAPSPFAR